MAIVGRPNVGKSTLFNRLIGEERSVVHDLPGTTRDAIDTVVETPDGPVRFIDTAGLRRPARTDAGTEHHSFVRALQALDRADVALLVIDATVGRHPPGPAAGRAHRRLGLPGHRRAATSGTWSTLDDRDDVLAGVGDRLAFLGEAPVLKISALSGKGVHRILPALRDSIEAYHQRVPTGALNRAVQELQPRQPAPRARIRYTVQGATDPPTFTLFTNGRLPQTYLRYIERGTPRELRPRRHADEAAGADRRQVRSGRPDAWCEECDTLVEDEDLGEEGECPTCGTILAEQERAADPVVLQGDAAWPPSIYLGYRGYQGVTWIAGHV